LAKGIQVADVGSVQFKVILTVHSETSIKQFGFNQAIVSHLPELAVFINVLNVDAVVVAVTCITVLCNRCINILCI
jgi:hypothetical protein